MPALETFAIEQGQKQASNALDAIMGMGIAKYNDRRQLKQQRKLQDLQIAGSKELTDYSYGKQLQMWKDTNYGAQMEQLTKAGLNPGLIYGMGGAGGATTGGGQGNVQGASAPSGGMEIMNMLQMKTQQAQIELAQAQADKARAEAEKTRGVDTDETQARIQNLSQDIQNKQAQQKMTIVQTKLAELDKAFNQATYEDRMDYIKQQARQMTGLATQALTEGNLATDARQTKLQIIKTQLVQKTLENLLITAQTKREWQDIAESKSKVALNQKLLYQMSEELTLKYRNMSNEERKTWLQDLQIKNGIDEKEMPNLINKVIETLDAIIPF